MFDGNYRTHDEDYIWKSKFNEKPIELKIEFENAIQLGLIRIWNYNKSRIYTYRGVKDLELYLDDVKIFDGLITKANGELKGSLDQFGDVSIKVFHTIIGEQFSDLNEISFCFFF